MIRREKELLAEAGYPDGFEVTLHFMPVSISVRLFKVIWLL